MTPNKLKLYYIIGSGIYCGLLLWSQQWILIGIAILSFMGLYYCLEHGHIFTEKEREINE